MITGATRGIGRATAEALARTGATVIVHGRDPDRVEHTCNLISHSANHSRVHGATADLASLIDVRRLAAEVGDRHRHIDVLINNAGALTRQRRESVDGFELQLAVNHLAPFLLTHLLLGKLKASSPARIVNVASMAHRRAALDLDDLNWNKRRYSSLGAYGATKLANISFTRELATRLDAAQVTVNCLHPGVVATNLFAGLGAAGRVFGSLAKLFLLSSERGAATSVYLAASREIDGVSGQFFDRSAPVEPSAAAKDPETARRLWRQSEAMTGLGRG